MPPKGYRKARKPKDAYKEGAPVSKEQRLKVLYAKLEELKEKERELKESNKIEFFEPIGSKEGEIPYQTKVLEHLHSGKKVIALVGGNGIGKTVLGAVICGSACLGIEPWSGRDTVWGNRKVSCRILCSDWEKHAATVIVPKLKEWLPVGTYTTAKNNVGVESKWTFQNGSMLELITNKQETSDHEGWEGDLVWADEPFSHDKFVANLRGLRRPPDKGGMGVFLLTQTNVSEAWILDEIIMNPDPAYASVTEIPQDANPYLSDEYKRIFRASLRPNEIIARVEGKFLNLVGLVWKGFNRDTHVIDPFEIPTDWPVVPVIDFHPSHPNAIGYYAWDPWDREYVVDETWGHMSAEQVGDDIVRHMRRNAWRISDAFIDPLSKGDMAYIKNLGIEGKDTFSKLSERLWQHGIQLHVASKDKASGIRNVEEMLEGPNKTPTLFFFRDLNKIDREGHLWEIQRWTYDDKNKPRDENDHFMECLYRSTLTGTKYTKPTRANGLKSETDFNVFDKDYGIVQPSEREFDVFA